MTTLYRGTWGLPGAKRGPCVPGADAFCARPVHELLQEAAVRAPQAIALVSRASSLTYSELLRLAQNAAAAIAALVPPDQPVACVLSRTPEAMAGLLGCLMSGRLCMVLNPANPVERQAMLLDDAAPAALLLDKPLGFPNATPVLTLDAALSGPGGTWRPDRHWDPDAPFAVHFTSGSTGRPKGIVLSARSALYRGLHASESIGLGGNDRIYIHSLHVESSGLAGLLGALAKGARILLANAAVDGAGGLLRLLEREAATVLTSSSRLLRTLCHLDRARDAFRMLHTLRIGAGALARADIENWRELLPPGCRVLHCYGSTEALVIAQWFVPGNDAAAEPVVAAGIPQPGYDLAVVGQDGDAVLSGDIGELVVRSRYIALGEWQDGGVARGPMLPVPDRPGWREFRTGDLVRMRGDGMMRVVGRADRQVKINGVRIEPAEIEGVLRAEPGVMDAAVVARTGPEGVTLHGFVATTKADEAALIAALRQRLVSALPMASRPARLTILDRLPTLPGGKIDLGALSRWPAN
jgi:acyl-CoA synthetase (AMP-forming)/AMP-acid ligase II